MSTPIPRMNVSLRTLALTALVAVGCSSGSGDPVTPEPTAEVSGRVVLFPVNGTPTDNGGARVTIEGQPGLEAVTDANGDFQLKNIRPGVADLVVSKPGYGEWREVDKRLDANNGYVYGGIHLGEIPRATVSTLSATTTATAVRLSGTVSELGLAERDQIVMLYVGVPDTVSNDPHSHSVRTFVTLDAGTRSFSHTYPASYFLSIGLASGMRLHAAAYVMDRQTCTRFPVPGLALDWLTSLSTPPQRASFVIP